MFFATCWVIVEAPIGRRCSLRRPISVMAARRIDAVLDIEIFILGRDKRVFDERRDRLYRHEQAPLARVFGQQPAVPGINAGHNRRLVMGELLVIGQITPKIP
jgi:hypothetical protein